MASGTFFPSIIILGTPKSGTSSLHEWLSAHPQIGEGSEKEVRFLLDAEEPLSRPDGYAKTGVEGYSRYFPDLATASKTYWIDSSPTYYYQKTALDVIAAREQLPFLGLMYRRPGARIHSYFQYAVQNTGRLRRDMTFEEFLQAAEQGEHGPLRDTPGLSRVLDHSDYAKYTKRWLERIPRDRFFFLTFDEVIGNPLAVVKRLCNQFDLDPAFYDTYGFPQENRTYYVKNPALHGFTYKMAKALTLPAGVRRTLRNLYESVNTREMKRDKDDRTKELIAELDRRYAPSVAQLEDLIGLDLSAWRV